MSYEDIVFDGLDLIERRLRRLGKDMAYIRDKLDAQ